MARSPPRDPMAPGSLLQRSPDPLAGEQGNIPSPKNRELRRSALAIFVDHHNVVDGAAPMGM